MLNVTNCLNELLFAVYVYHSFVDTSSHSKDTQINHIYSNTTQIARFLYQSAEIPH